MSYNGSSGISITIPSASVDNPYQYCVVKPNEVFDTAKVTWYTISKGTAVKVLASRAVEDSQIYIRQKEIKSKKATNTSSAVVELASTCVTYKVEYPAVPKVEVKDFTFVKGVTDDLSFNIKLNKAGRLPFETKIKSIKLGAREIEFSTTTDLVEPLNPNVEYNINVTLSKDVLNNLPNSYSRALTITFENGLVDKTSVKLAIKSPTAAATLSTAVTKGKKAGTTSVRVTNSLRQGCELVYTITSTKVEGIHTENIITDGIKFVQQEDIAVTTGDYLTVYEINSTTKKVERYRCILITASQIG